MSAFAMSPNASLRIVSLPNEMTDAYDVSAFVSTDLGFGEAVWVNIVNMTTDRGVSYRTAFVDITRTPENAPRTNDLLNDFIFPSNGRFHFDNGKPMDHLKIVSCTRNKPSVDPLLLNDGEWSSLYLPIVPKDLSLDNGDLQFHDQFALYEFFEDHLKLGKVDRIDYTAKTDGKISAFVHFEHWYDNRTTNQVRKAIETHGQFSCKGYYDGFEFLNFDNGGYLVLKKDTQGVTAKQDTDEMSPIYDSAKQTIINHEKKIQELEAEISKLKSYSIVPVPGMNVHLDVGNIVAENHRLKEASAKPLPLAQAFVQIHVSLDGVKAAYEKLLAEYGTEEAVEASGILDSPAYQDLRLDYIEEIKDLYEEWVPIIWR
jgi:hypothetical protein